MQGGDIPFTGHRFRRDAAGDHVVDNFMAHVDHGLMQFFCAHQILALLIDDLALVIHDIVVLQQVLTNVEVAGFNLRLGFFDGLVDPGMNNRFVFLQAEFLQHAVHALGPENAHQVVFKAEIEF